MLNYDLVVIGAGIHGAGVAQAAAAQGYKVLILEQTGIASGTSHCSSKLIHGGLRYLETAQFGLVRECLRERQILLTIAPDLVQLQPFYIPVYRQTTRSPWQLRTGLLLYQVLGGGVFHTVPRTQWQGLDGLQTQDLRAVLQYWDAQTDDAALTRAVIHSAQTLGATLILPAPVTAIELRATQAEVVYEQAGQTHTVRASAVVNAAGPWVNQVLARVRPEPAVLPIHWVQGTHLLLDNTTIQQRYYVEAPQDRRAVFVLAYQGKVLLGTTETRYQGDLQTISPQPEEVSYLQAVFQHYFPQQLAVMVDAFAGLRVLPAGQGREFSKPRDTRFQLDRPQQPRLLSIYGGKLTAYRITAQRVMQQLSPSLPKPSRHLDTQQIILGR